MYKNDVNKQINTSAYAFYFFFFEMCCAYYKFLSVWETIVSTIYTRINETRPK